MTSLLIANPLFKILILIPKIFFLLHFYTITLYKLTNRAPLQV